MSRTLVAQSQNLALWSEDFGNAAWNVSNAITVTTDQTTAPDGTVSADLIAASGGVNRHYVAQAWSIQSPYAFTPRLVTMSCFVKKSVGNWVALTDERHTDFIYGWFDVQNGVTGTDTGVVTSATVVSKNIVALPASMGGGGWFRISMTYLMTSPSGGAGPNAQCLAVGPASANGVQSYDSAGGNACFVWGAQLTAGTNNPGTYTKTTNAAVNTGTLRSIS